MLVHYFIKINLNELMSRFFDLLIVCMRIFTFRSLYVYVIVESVCVSACIHVNT